MLNRYSFVIHVLTLARISIFELLLTVEGLADTNRSRVCFDDFRLVLLVIGRLFTFRNPSMLEPRASNSRITSIHDLAGNSCSTAQLRVNGSCGRYSNITKLSIGIMGDDSSCDKTSFACLMQPETRILNAHDPLYYNNLKGTSVGILAYSGICALGVGRELWPRSGQENQKHAMGNPSPQE